MHSAAQRLHSLSHAAGQPRFALCLLVIALVMAPSIAQAIDPVAEASPANVTAAGATTYSFTVDYYDDGVVQRRTLDSKDVRVTGPGGFNVAAEFLDASSQVDASPLSATYSIVPPGGSWDAADNGTYSIVMQSKQVLDFRNAAVRPGTIATFEVAIGDTAPRPAQPLNIATRLRVQTGENVMIGGFIVSGNAPKKIIVRAIGPSLQQAGITNALADPVVELRGADGALLATNDDWRQSQEGEIQASGVAPPNDRESAIIATLASGNHTAIVSGKGSSIGVGLVEVYDLDAGADARLVNLSTRGFVETGNDVMIGGFILGNASESARVVLRAIGPSLAGAGVSGALADPTLQLFNGNGDSVAANNNWRDAQQAELQATGIAPPHDLEAAIVANLSPGAYTAVVAGNGGATGVALVELYQLSQ